MSEMMSAVEYARTDTYCRLPSLGKRKSVTIGKHIRLVYKDKDDDRYFIWVRVTGRSIARYTGEVARAPWNSYIRFPRDVKRGQTVRFLPRHILAIANNTY